LAGWICDHWVHRSDCRGGYRRGKDGRIEQYTHKYYLWLSPIRDDLLRPFRATTFSDVVGLHMVRHCRDGVCRPRITASDIDRHRPTDDPRANWRAALAWNEQLINIGYNLLLIDSNGAGGFRNVVVFNDWVPTVDVHTFLCWLTWDWEELGLTSRPETFPRQPCINAPGSGFGSYGNWLRLPGKHPKRPHWSRIWHDGRWLEGDEAIDAILATTGDDPALIPAAALAAPDPPARRTIILRATPPRTERPPAPESGERSEPEVFQSLPVGVSQIKQARQALRYLDLRIKGPRVYRYVHDRDLWLLIGMSLREL
jgi:hypothetical protein